jgi:predicted acyl esterase
MMKEEITNIIRTAEAVGPILGNALKSGQLFNPQGASEQKLKAGEIAPVDIELYPSSTFFAVGETLQLILASDEIIPSPPYRKSVDCNHGKHVLHFGGKHDSYLLIPKIPPREERLKGGGTKCEPVE